MEFQEQITIIKKKVEYEEKNQLMFNNQWNREQSIQCIITTLKTLSSYVLTSFFNPPKELDWKVQSMLKLYQKGTQPKQNLSKQYINIFVGPFQVFFYQKWSSF